MSGKGSAPRPFSVPDEEYADNWERTFRKPAEPQEEEPKDG
jgi:hypothetical protein